MHNKNIIKLLNIQAKNVILEKFYFNSEDNTWYIHISKKIVIHKCPHCHKETKRIHDHRFQKVKHTPINGNKCIIVLKKTRLYCKDCKKSFYMNYSDIVNRRFRSSNALFNKIINDLQYISTTFKDIAKINNVSIGVVIRYLNIFAYLMNWNNINILPAHIGIDEFKGNCDKSKYQFHVIDLDTRETVQILKSRKFNDVVNFFNSIDNRNSVKVVTSDLYNSFKNSVNAKLKNSIIIADRFHYTRIVSNALDSLRIKLWQNSKGDEKKFFKNVKSALLKNTENIKDTGYLLNLEAKINTAFEYSVELKYGYQLYQNFLSIKNGDTYQEKVSRFKDWIDDALSCTIPEFKSAAETLLKWNKEILNSFKYSYTNSSTEGKNNKIKVIKRNAYGFKKLNNLKYLIKLRDCKV